MRLWQGTTLPATSGLPQFTLVFNSPGTVRRVFSPAVELNGAAAFIRGEFDIQGDIFSAFGLLRQMAATLHSAKSAGTLLRYWLSLPRDDQSASAPSSHQANLAGVKHSKTRDQAAIQHHYDVGNAFYALFLDPRMVYSCAYFPSGAEDLASAQACKLDMICRKLRLQPGERVLDIGCGWGGWVMYAAQHYGIRALGVTLSAPQHALANERIQAAGLGDQIEVKLMDYRDLDDGAFDKLVSIGMFEHVGRSHLPEYFAHAYRLLKPGGVFLNHGISLGNLPALQRRSRANRLADHLIMGNGLFGERYIFPDGELAPVSEVNLMAEGAGFEVRDVENWREHYALTLRHWVRRLEANQAEAIRLNGEALYRTWRLYMAGSAEGFDSGRLNVNQTLLAKPDGGRSKLPWSRADWYA
ncbi:MAG: class I SAM-dependent methyltransferase [Anaerolineae bacterium]|nr:class I SAM-dependent methyltransferase [Anaerolineae bacterium]